MKMKSFILVLGMLFCSLFFISCKDNSNNVSNTLPVGHRYVVNVDGSIEVTFKVNRTLNANQLLEQSVASGTDRSKRYINPKVLDQLPLIPGNNEEKVTLVFWKQGTPLTNSQLAAERTKRGLVQDLPAQFAYNAINPEFADNHPNGDSWKDAAGNWNGAYFGRWFDDREVYVLRDDSWLAWSLVVWRSQGF